MDTITHGIVGALAGKAFFAGRDVPVGSVDGAQSVSQSDFTARAAITACTLGAIFPDIDVFAGPVARNPLAMIEWHRNITHSIVMLPMWALVLAAASFPLGQWVGWKLPSFVKLTGIYAFGLASHIFLDVLTNFGTMVWSPLNYSRVAWDWLFILDLGFSGIALVPQLASWCYREPEKFTKRTISVWIVLIGGICAAYALADTAGYGFPVWVVVAVSLLVGGIVFMPSWGRIGFQWRRSSWCRAGIAALCVYIAFAAAAHQKAMAYTRNFAASQHLRVENLAALPLPPTLTHWTGVITTPEGIWRTTFHVPGGTIERTRLYADAESDRYVTAAKRLRDVQIYLWFARFPVWYVSQNEGQTVVDVSDLRFFRGEDKEDGSHQVPQPRHLQKKPPKSAGFTFEIVFGATGLVVSHGFKRPE